MKRIIFNAALIYIVKLLSSMIAYPFIAIIVKYVLKNDIYQIQLFTIDSLWYHFIYFFVNGAFWTPAFYLLSALIQIKMKPLHKILIVGFLLIIVDLFFTYLHQIVYNKTFFKVQIFEILFIEYLVMYSLIFIVFLYLYMDVWYKSIKRPTVLP